MPDYRAYPIDTDGRVMVPEIITADTDDNAVTQARTFLNGKPIEVWDGARLVARLESRSKSRGGMEDILSI